MVQTTTGRVEIAGGGLYYEVSGAGETVVLCHAGFVDSRMWDTQWEVLRQRYRVIRFDMRGFGRSDALAGPVVRRRELAALLDHLGVERAALVGCSLGGETVLDLALEEPTRVSALVIVSAVPDGFQMQGEPPAELLAMFGAIAQGDLEAAAEWQNRLWVDGPFRTPAQVSPEVRAQVTHMSHIALTNQTWSQSFPPAEPLEPPAAPRLPALHVPALVVSGALDHPEVRRAADFMTAHIPGARQLVLDHSAHLPNMEQPAAFNAALLAFLEAATVQTR